RNQRACRDSGLLKRFPSRRRFKVRFFIRLAFGDAPWCMSVIRAGGMHQQYFEAFRPFSVEERASRLSHGLTRAPGGTVASPASKFVATKKKIRRPRGTRNEAVGKRHAPSLIPPCRRANEGRLGNTTNILAPATGDRRLGDWARANGRTGEGEWARAIWLSSV